MSFRPQKIARNLVERIYWDRTVGFRTDRQVDKRRNKDSQDRRPHRNRYLDKHIFRVNTIWPHTSDNGNKHKRLMHETIRILEREWSLLRPLTRGEPVRPRKGSPVQWPWAKLHAFRKEYMQKEETTMAGVSSLYPPAQETHRVLHRNRKHHARAAFKNHVNKEYQATSMQRDLIKTWATNRIAPLRTKTCKLSEAQRRLRRRLLMLDTPMHAMARQWIHTSNRYFQIYFQRLRFLT